MNNSNLTRRQFLQFSGITAGTVLAASFLPCREVFASNIGNSIPGPIIKDASGLITTQIFYYRSFKPRQHFFEYEVDSAGDMVAVGGGVVGIENPGALVFASHPNDDMSAWMIGTKDHNEAAKYWVTGYAIGMKIEGMTKAELVESMFVAKQESGHASHPTAITSLPPEYTLLGGGVKVEWDGAGNLVTATYPTSSNTWEARSKDHGTLDSGDLTVYAIGIKRNLPVGNIRSMYTITQSQVAQHPTANAKLPGGYALTGGGAFVDWHGDGNLIWKLEPYINQYEQGFIAASKDHGTPDPASIRVYALGAQIF